MIYKRKAQRVLPLNVPKADRLTPGGEVFWKDTVKEAELLKGKLLREYDRWITPWFSIAPIGARLASNRLSSISIRPELNKAERALLMVCLQNQEITLSWNLSKISRVRPKVSPPLTIDTQEHIP